MASLSSLICFPDPTVKRSVASVEKRPTSAQLKQIHSLLFKTGQYADPIVTTKLIAISAGSQNMAYANKIFACIPEPSTLTWNALIRGYANSEEPEKALFFFNQMLLSSVQINNHTFPFLLKACTLRETLQVHSQMVKLGFISDIFAANSLLSSYAVSAGIAAADALFRRIPEKDIVSWNILVNAHVKHGDVANAEAIFNDIPMEKNAVSFTTMIRGFADAGLTDEAVKKFRQMMAAGLPPDKVAVTHLVTACADGGLLNQGRWAHSFIIKNKIEIDYHLGSALITMYGKCGSMEEAVGAFRSMKKKDTSSWTAVISGFAMNGKEREAIKWFGAMLEEGIRPNEVTFTAILTACGRAGFVEEGKMVYDGMSRVYGVRPTVEHCGCMVEMLGNAGLIEEARVFIEKMPVKANEVVWGSFVSACKKHGQLGIGEEVGKMLVEMDGAHGGRYVQLAGVYAAAGHWNLAADVRKEMRGRGVIKETGCSAVYVNGVFHKFVAGGDVQECE